jgi:hypothetical protein
LLLLSLPMPRCRIALLSTLSAVFIACGPDSPPPGDVDPQVAADSAPVWKDARGWKVGAHPTTTIGVDDGPEEYQLSGVTGVLRLADGTLVVGNRLSGEIHYYSPRGQHLRTIGRKGGGPGEFRLIDWMGQRGDSVLVWDPFSSRLTVFDPGGRLARAVRVAPAEGLFHSGVGAMEDGSLLLRPTPPAATRRDGELTDSVTYLRVSIADGHLVGKIGPFLRGERLKTTSGMNDLTTDLIFGRKGVLAVGRRQVFTGETTAFVLTARAYDGTPVRTFGRPHTPVRASAADVRAARAQRLAEESIGNTDAAIGEMQRKQFAVLPHRDTLPAFSRVLVDGEGNVWMEEFRIDPAAAATWSVFDADGRWLGRVETPAGLKVMLIAGGTVVGVTRDDVGVERVAVYPLVR